MPTPRLPPETFDRHFPGSGNGQYPVIETDGECLIFRRAVKINGKNYDVKIWRFDAQKDLIRLNKDSGFLRDTLVEVQKLANGLFKDNFQNPTDARIWYDDTNPASPVCQKETISLPDSDDSKYTNMHPDHQQVIDTMQAIHHLFFHNITTVLTTEADTHLFPKEVPKDPIPAVDESEATAPAKKRKKKKATEIPENIRIHLPPPFVAAVPSSGTTSTGTQSVTSEGADHVATLQEELDATSAKYAGANFLTGITHTELADYARLKVGDNPKLPRAYEVYREVLVNPGAAGADQDAMREWLRQHYITAYKRFHNHLKPVFDADTNKQGKDFDQWCKYYAARAVAGFLLVDKQPIKQLEDLLMTTPIPAEPAAVTVTVTPKAKSKWSIWHPFS